MVKVKNFTEVDFFSVDLVAAVVDRADYDRGEFFGDFTSNRFDVNSWGVAGRSRVANRPLLTPSTVAAVSPSRY